MQGNLVQNIDQIQINLNSDNIWLVNLTLALVMFGVALDIKVSDFTNMIKAPKPVLIGIFSQFFLIPLVTYIIIIIANPVPSIALGMFMVAACPGGNISNFMSKLAGGNPALSISLTAFASFAALIMTPLNFALWGNLYEPTAILLKTISLDPFEVGKLVLLIIGIPLFLGMGFNYYKPQIAIKVSKFLKPVSIIIFIAFIAVAFYNNLKVFLNYIHYVFILVIIHNIILYFTGFYTAKFSGLSYINQKTLSIETGIQNSGLGLLLVFSFFEGLGGMAILVAFWAIWDILSSLLLASYWSYKTKKTVIL
ncbi:MAG: bile acid:sodium symporter family protein [Bacteroidota bacterium]